MTQADDLAAIRAQLAGVTALLERTLDELLKGMHEGAAADVATAVAANAETEVRRARVAVCEAHTRQLEDILAALKEIAEAKTTAATTAASHWAVARQILVPAATLVIGGVSVWLIGKLGVPAALVAALMGGS